MSARRTYEQTHPWIAFRLDLNQAPPNLWTLLGQAVAFCRQVSQAALLPDITERFRMLFLNKGARATTAIEGNTLTEEQVQAQIEGTLDLPPSQEYLQQEVDNILQIFGTIESAMDPQNPPRLTVDLIREYNGRILEGLGEHLAEGVVPGEIRAYSAGVGRYKGAPPEDCEYLLERLCDWLEEKTEIPFFAEEDDRRVAAGILQAILAHLYIAWIHPFGDGNGRTARLLEFMMQARAGVPFLSAHLLSDHYNMTRTRYYRELDRSSQVHDGKGDAFGFLEYALQGFVDGLQKQCKIIQGHQLAIVWEHFIYGVFAKEKRSRAMHRRRELALELGRRAEFVSKKSMPLLTPSLARGYANKTYKTLTRDLNWLMQEDLIERDGRTYQANLGLMWVLFAPHLSVDNFISLLYSAHKDGDERE